jgi:hypothetical protein
MGQQAHVKPDNLRHPSRRLVCSCFAISEERRYLPPHSTHTTAPSSITPSHNGAGFSPAGQSKPHPNVPRVHCHTLHQAMDMCIHFLMYFTHTNCDEK